MGDVRALLGQHPMQARQMLRKLLNGRVIEMEPVIDAGQRGHRFRGVLSLGRVLRGHALDSRRLGTPAEGG